MAVSKAQIKATTKYESANYDKVLVRLPKGKRAEVQEHAKRSGQSLNSFIVSAVDEKIEKSEVELHEQ